MNPFTRAILKRRQSRQAQDFVRHWDALEALVIRVYKAGQASTEDQSEYHSLRNWLQASYPHWQAGLAPYWRRAILAGEPASEDPFALLISTPSASEFAGSWRLMQALPAAREALNQFLIDLR